MINTFVLVCEKIIMLTHFTALVNHSQFKPNNSLSPVVPLDDFNEVINCGLFIVLWICDT